ncbi:hypothetical protein, partial [Verrucomicrobium spinosum]|uniref:hypothetical protein n=1 Tax=Verrucomicrobium spinosum TaxID=2736 RepID=UPI000B23BC8B
RASAEQAAAAAARTKPKSSSLPWAVLTVGVLAAGAAGFYYLKDWKGKNGLLEEGSKAPPKHPGTSPSASQNGTPTATAAATLEGASSPAPTIPSEVAQRLAALETQFQSAVQRDVIQIKEAALRDLNSKFLAALDRTMINAAAGTATPQEIAALNAEKKRVSQNQPLPNEDGPEISSGSRTYAGSIGRPRARLNPTPTRPSAPCPKSMTTCWRLMNRSWSGPDRKQLRARCGGGARSCEPA